MDRRVVVPERFHDAGDTVIVEGRGVGVTKSGNRLDSPAASVWTLRDAKAVANHNFHDTDALRIAFSAPNSAAR